LSTTPYLAALARRRPDQAKPASFVFIVAADRSIVAPNRNCQKKESATSASSRSAAQADRAGRSDRAAPLARARMHQHG
jgi:hypothetical protein